MVLDTFQGTHELKKVLPLLLRNNQIDNALRERMKRTFVAMTRPRELLCLAMRRDHFDMKKTNRERFRRLGWEIEEV